MDMTYMAISGHMPRTSSVIEFPGPGRFFIISVGG